MREIGGMTGNSLRKDGDNVSFSEIVVKSSNEDVGRIYSADLLSHAGRERLRVTNPCNHHARSLFPQTPAHAR